MNKIKTLLVDDEKGSRDVLLSLLEHFSAKVEVIGEAANVEEAYRLILSEKPQLVLLDIQMPRANGFELLKKFDKVPFEVIFVTSFDKYAINAIKFSALDYLLKPVEITDLEAAILRVGESIELKANKGPQIINLLHTLEGDVKDRKIAIHSGDKVKMLSELNITFIEGDARYCHVHTNTDEVFTVAKYLKDFEEYLTPDFVRISNSYLINTRHIKEYSKSEPFTVEMVNGKILEMSRRKRQEVLERLRK